MSSPYINHFLQPDTLIPDPSNPQAWNRYSYVYNNPINANDPSGHKCVGEEGGCFDDDGQVINGAGGWGGGNSEGSEDESSGDGDLIERIKDIFIDIATNSITYYEPDYKGCNALGMSMGVCSATINVLKTTTIIADALGLLISAVEWTMVGPPLIAGLLIGAFMALVEPEILLGLPEAVSGFLAYDAGVATAFSPFEDTLGGVSLVTTAATDWLQGYTYVSNGNYYLGTSTANSLVTGAAGLVPEANLDFAASAYQFFVADLSLPSGSINLNQAGSKIGSLCGLLC